MPVQAHENLVALGVDRLSGGGSVTGRDTMEVDYLNGQEIPTIRRMETPGQLGFVWDIYLDWGISVMDERWHCWRLWRLAR